MYKIFILSSIVISLYIILLIIYISKSKMTKKTIYNINFNFYVICILASTLFFTTYSNYIFTNYNKLNTMLIPAIFILLLMSIVLIQLLVKFVRYVKKEDYNDNIVEKRKQLGLMLNDLDKYRFKSIDNEEDIEII